MRRTDSLTLSWSKPAAGSGSIVSYTVQARYSDKETSDGWTTIGTTTNTELKTTPSEYGFVAIKPRGVLEYRVNAKNSYGVNSDYAAANVSIRGGTVSLKSEGQWQPDCQMYIKVGGIWKEADDLYVKVNGSWRQQ